MSAEALYLHQLEREVEALRAVADAARACRVEAREGRNMAMISGDTFRALRAALDVCDEFLG
jgi:hypothetical protein